MSSYQITTKTGTDMGTFECQTAVEAVDLYVRSLGYATVAIAAEVVGQTEDEFFADLTVEEVEDENDEAPETLRTELLLGEWTVVSSSGARWFPDADLLLDYDGYPDEDDQILLACRETPARGTWHS